VRSTIEIGPQKPYRAATAIRNQEYLGLPGAKRQVSALHRCRKALSQGQSGAAATIATPLNRRRHPKRCPNRHRPWDTRSRRRSRLRLLLFPFLYLFKLSIIDSIYSRVSKLALLRVLACSGRWPGLGRGGRPPPTALCRGTAPARSLLPPAGRAKKKPGCKPRHEPDITLKLVLRSAPPDCVGPAQRTPGQSGVAAAITPPLNTRKPSQPALSAPAMRGKNSALLLAPASPVPYPLSF